MSEPHRDATLGLLTELAMGIVSFRLYGREHPRTAQAVARASENLERLLAGSGRGSLTLLELEGQLLVEAQPVSHLGPQAASVARAMRRADLERITVSRGIRAEEVEALLGFLARPEPPPPELPHVAMGLVELVGGEAGGGEQELAAGPAAMLRDRVQVVGEFLEAAAGGAEGALPLAEDLARELDRRAQELHPLELLAPLEEPGGWPAVHSHNVAALTAATARLLGFEREERLDLVQAALFHDVGRVGQREAWLHDLELEGDLLEGDPGHPVRGLQMVLGVTGVPGIVPLVVVGHHLDPGGREPEGDPFPVPPHPAARLVGAMESLDILHTVRGPAGRITREGALAWIQERSGSRMDPFLCRLLAAFLETVPGG